MNMFFRYRNHLSGLGLSLLLGCTNIQTAEMDSAENGYAIGKYADGQQYNYNLVRKAANTMLEGIRLYDKGDYLEAIEQFSSAEMESAPVVLRVEAAKYRAFSYCVIENYVSCRQAFDQAFSMDAGFELLSSEGGHPMWGPVFEQARIASRQARSHLPAGQERERWRGIDPWRPR
ncbi:TssQ family T6SS-associated lipoprotein [Massilia sp. IC2-278]|uniref:TssQ family T6SS-associated lipoprotein n=1 Tax=Massilia sp. IC2-278 TaxID=2887200 RepID=UPI001E3C1EDC|nr:TssQ family T6SS-associated lipoprotein [Massilia sp. IC2-278]MCC2963066.1 TssQ family T6SS-associated lipoprotein [Massilia sp. IC2-278]